jgi:hypothetical protein
VTDRIGLLAFAVIGAAASWGCRWVLFHPKRFILKFFPYYDEYYKPGRLSQAQALFLGWFGHIGFTIMAIAAAISVFVPSRFALSFFVHIPSIAIAVLIWTKSLRGVSQSQQEDRSA